MTDKFILNEEILFGEIVNYLPKVIRVLKNHNLYNKLGNCDDDVVETICNVLWAHRRLEYNLYYNNTIMANILSIKLKVLAIGEIPHYKLQDFIKNLLCIFSVKGAQFNNDVMLLLYEEIMQLYNKK